MEGHCTVWVADSLQFQSAVGGDVQIEAPPGPGVDAVAYFFFFFLKMQILFLAGVLNL